MRIEVDIALTPRQIAEAFCDMNDEQQAQVFIEAAEIAKGWGIGDFAQWYMAGRHLATCECSTDEARELVQSIAQGSEYRAAS